MSLNEHKLKQVLKSLEVSPSEIQKTLFFDKVLRSVDDESNLELYTFFPESHYKQLAIHNEDYYQEWKKQYIRINEDEFNGIVEDIEWDSLFSDTDIIHELALCRHDQKLRQKFQALHKAYPDELEPKDDKVLFEKAGLIYFAKQGLSQSKQKDLDDEAIIQVFAEKELELFQQTYQSLSVVHNLSKYIGKGPIMDRRHFKVIMRKLADDNENSYSKFLEGMSITNKSAALSVIENLESSMEKKQKAAKIINIVSIAIQLTSLCVAALSMSSLHIGAAEVTATSESISTANNTRALSLDLMHGVKMCLQGDLVQGSISLLQKCNDYSRLVIGSTSKIAMTFNLLSSSAITTLNIAGGSVAFASAVLSFAIAGINLHRKYQALKRHAAYEKAIKDVEEQIIELENSDDAESQQEISELRQLQKVFSQLSFDEKEKARECQERMANSIKAGLITTALGCISILTAVVITNPVVLGVLAATALVIGLCMTIFGRRIFSRKSKADKTLSNTLAKDFSDLFYSDASTEFINRMNQKLQVDLLKQVFVEGKEISFKDFLRDLINSNPIKANEVLAILKKAACDDIDANSLQFELESLFSKEASYLNAFINSPEIDLATTHQTIGALMRSGGVDEPLPANAASFDDGLGKEAQKILAAAIIHDELESSTTVPQSQSN